tara:strand:+ start:1431 stop:2657 length:1227 start_codon:yes stop_codon:yes gene_type:complete
MSDLSIKKVALRHLKKEARLPKELMLLQQQILQAQSISDQIEEVVEGFKSHYASVQVKKNSQKQRRVAKNIKDQLITQYSAASVAKATIEKMQDAYSMLSSASYAAGGKDRQIQRMLRDAQDTINRLEKQIVDAEKMLKTLASKNVPTALKKMVNSVKKMVGNRISKGLSVEVSYSVVPIEYNGNINKTWRASGCWFCAQFDVFGTYVSDGDKGYYGGRKGETQTIRKGNLKFFVGEATNWNGVYMSRSAHPTTVNRTENVTNKIVLEHALDKLREECGTGTLLAAHKKVKGKKLGPKQIKTFLEDIIKRIRSKADWTYSGSLSIDSGYNGNPWRIEAEWRNSDLHESYTSYNRDEHYEEQERNMRSIENAIAKTMPSNLWRMLNFDWSYGEKGYFGWYLSVKKDFRK